MKFKEIYERILPLWGGNINFEDAVTTDGTAIFTQENFYSKKMEKKWDCIQESIKEADTFGDLMVWTMFQVFQFHAVKLINQNTNYFKPSTVNSDEIETQYFENLHEESWEEVLAKYDREK